MPLAFSLPPRRYALPLNEPVQGARDRHSVLRGALIGYQAGSQQAWMTAADLPGRPQWREAILRFAHQVAHTAAEASAEGLTWPEVLARRWNTQLRQQIPLQLTAALAEVATGHVDRLLIATGCRALKLKVDLAVDEGELHRVLVPLQHRHPGLELRLDANQSWDPLPASQLRQRLLACAEVGVAIVEDPVLPQHWPDNSPLPLAADLVDSDAKTLVQLAERGLLSLAVVKPSLCGSLEALEELLAELSSLGVPVALSSLFDAPTGLRMLAGIAAALPGKLVASGLATHLTLPHPWRSQRMKPTDGAWNLKTLWHGAEFLECPQQDLADLWAQAAVDAPDEPALVWPPTGQRWTYAALDRRIDAASAWLTDRGVAAGDRVVLWADNCPEVVVAFAALWRIGAVVAPLHPKLTPSEVTAMQHLILPVLGLYGAGHPGLSLPAVPGLWQPLGAWQEQGPGIIARRYTQEAALVATSGTTGQPKLAILTHPALQAAAAAHWQATPPQPHERWLACLPLCHVSGLSVLFRCVAARACVVLTPDAHVPQLAETLQRWQPTTLSVVPTLLLRLLEAFVAPGKLQVVLVGGASCDPALLQRARRAGWPVRATYGMTETCAQLATARVDEPLEQQHGLRRIGPLLPGMRARVAGGEPEGELEVAGPQLLQGYLGQAVLQANSLADPLWWATGDHGMVTAEGVLWVASRRADRILRGGENIDPLEVEAVLQGITGVTEAAVVGLADPQLGEIVAAWLVVEGDLAQWPARARAHILRIAAFKRPQRWHFSHEPLPRNALGKLQRDQLRRQWAQLPEELAAGPESAGESLA